MLYPRVASAHAFGKVSRSLRRGDLRLPYTSWSHAARQGNLSTAQKRAACDASSIILKGEDNGWEH